MFLSWYHPEIFRNYYRCDVNAKGQGQRSRSQRPWPHLCLSHIQPRAPYDFYHPYDFLPVLSQSHPTTGPVRFSSPVWFLARKAEWSARGNFTSVLFPWSHQATGPVRLDTAAYLLWFGWIIRRTPRVPRAMPVLAPHGNLQCFSYPTGPVRGPCVTHKGAVRRPYAHVRELTQP